MPDITMCTNSDCPIRSACYRYRAKPNDTRQSYCRFEPYWSPCDQFDRHLEPDCHEFWECRDYPDYKVEPTEKVDLKLKGAKHGR